MKINQKKLKPYLILFTVFTIFYICLYKLGLENRGRSEPYMSGVLHPKSWKEVWQFKFGILFQSFFIAIFLGSLYNYVTRKKNN